MEKNNVPLSDIMEGTPRTAPIDLTRGKVNNGDSEIPTNATSTRVAPIQTGPTNMDHMTPINIQEILPKKQSAPTMDDELFSELDAAIDRECASITERIDAVVKAQEDEMAEVSRVEEEKRQKEEDDFALANHEPYQDSDEDLGLYDGKDFDLAISGSDIRSHTSVLVDTNNDSTVVMKDGNSSIMKKSSEEPIINPSISKPKNENILDNLDDDELFEDENSDNDEKENIDKMLESLKTEVKEKIKPIKKSLDLSKFTISKKSISVQKVMKMAIQPHQNIADWVLYSANRPISMTGLSGPEILKLNPENSNRNRLNTFRDMYRIIYDHVYDGNKPEFETWLKQLRYSDLQHVYFAIYMATFGGSNFINYSCPHCKKVFLKDVKFENMVEYADDNVKAEVRNILKMDTTSPSNDSYEADLVQISDKYVFALRTPPVWNVIMETASLSDQFLEKHADLIDVVSYIDSIYVIDIENNNLIPIDTKPEPNDQAKTSARRIKAFYDVIKTLSSEEYYLLRAEIGKYDEDASKISYLIPACECPECKKEIPANKDIGPDSMLFTRHQLAAIGNM